MVVGGVGSFGVVVEVFDFSDDCFEFFGFRDVDFVVQVDALFGFIRGIVRTTRS